MNILDISGLDDNMKSVLRMAVEANSLSVGFDNQGQLTLYTDLALDVESGELVSFDPDAPEGTYYTED